ncbi:hypothetical protein EVAR_20081_1 [Eumeta japonica]|uniref:Uncharacterized protein n=1 Tax=Eumeta variegata TaxID=151549 RepID=A0A4C1UI14_EUMVA|nr:hypothetical protein EVAR_20081_1 [Eumeta japonica]
MDIRNPKGVTSTLQAFLGKKRISDEGGVGPWTDDEPELLLTRPNVTATCRPCLVIVFNRFEALWSNGLADRAGAVSDTSASAGCRSGVYPCEARFRTRGSGESPAVKLKKPSNGVPGKTFVDRTDKEH